VVSYVPEDIAGAAGLVSAARKAGLVVAGASDVLSLARSGNRKAVGIVQRAARIIGQIIGQAVNVLDPEAVVLGGGLSGAGDNFRDELEASLRPHVWSEKTRTLPVLTAGLGSRSALIGAAASAIESSIPPFYGMSSPKFL
jgi:glucokinase